MIGAVIALIVFVGLGLGFLHIKLVDLKRDIASLREQLPRRRVRRAKAGGVS